jgi:hypothetical protein
MVVYPVLAVRAIRLADACLLREVAAVGANPAYEPAECSLRLGCNVEAGLEQQVQAVDRFAGERQAVRVGGAVTELYDQTGMILPCLGVA